MLLLGAIYRCTPVVAGTVLPKHTGYSQCDYQNAQVLVSVLVNAQVIVSVLNRFYQNAPVIVSALKALRDLYPSEKSSSPQSAFIMHNL